MSPRQPGPPPQLPGYTYVKLLGLGGFADVFLYEQRMPRQQVAVKVLTDDVVTESVREQFHAEANLMAQVSAHPSIVSVFQADIAADGRPYLIMEYCPGDNLWVRYRRSRLDVPESLRIGIQLASAVEVAHRTGILHRDIKPANVLMTEYDWPKLTDFGIASATGQLTEAAGMSVPWSPPETFADPPTGDERADVWALGATVYTLLAGRSPFEQPGGSNTTLDLIERIEKNPLPPIGRDDVPSKFEQVLGRAMAKRPASRFAKAIDLAVALQEVEIQLRLAPTPVVVRKSAPDDAGHRDDTDVAHQTRIRNVVTIAPQAGAPSAAGSTTGAHAPVAAAEPAAGRTAVVEGPTVVPVPTAGTAGNAAPARARSTGGLPVPLVADTIHRAPEAPPQEAPEAPADRSRRATVLLAAAGLVLAVVVALAFLLTDGGAVPGNAPEPTENALPEADEEVIFVPTPTDLVAEASPDGTTFTWTNPEPQDGDSYLWRRTGPEVETAMQTVEEPQVLVPGTGRICIEVRLVRANGRDSAQPAEGCTP